MELDPRAIAAGVRLDFRDSIGSTNAEALALARAGDGGPLWVAAEQQTAGRGRRGRAWHSPLGNLHASLLMTDACAPGRAAQLSFVAALALHDALSESASALAKRIALKWPNDLLLDGAKAAGILVEGETLPDGRFATVIGIGVNCAAHPPDTPYRSTSLAQAGGEATPQRLFPTLTRTMLARLAQWKRGDAFSAIREDWRARAAHIGERIRVHGTAEIAGVFEGIDADGRLLLRADDGAIQAFAAGEVRLPVAGRGEGNAA
jgi:BirA family biotin operon repressor/biotin-[acetyl-CoA-carboxylase] ligase